MTQVDLMSLDLVSTKLSLIFCSTRSAKLRFSRKPRLPRAYPRDKLNVFELKRSLLTSPEQDQPQVQILRLTFFRLLGRLQLKCLSRNADRPQQGWTRQFLGEIAMISCRSSLKLASLSIALGESLRLTLCLLASQDPPLVGFI